MNSKHRDYLVASSTFDRILNLLPSQRKTATFLASLGKVVTAIAALQDQMFEEELLKRYKSSN